MAAGKVFMLTTLAVCFVSLLSVSGNLVVVSLAGDVCSIQSSLAT